MKKLLIFSFFLTAICVSAQPPGAIVVVDFVKIQDEKKEEAVYFYENNWKVYRETALKKGYIQSYQLLTTPPDSIGNFDLVLMTGYADSLSFRKSEERFDAIIKNTNSGNQKLLNDTKPAGFRKVVFSKETKVLFSSQPPGRSKKNVK